MPYRTVDEAFNLLCSRLIPGATVDGKAASHRNSIRGRLEEYYDLRALFDSGSSENGTSIRGHSDMDMFARIPTEKLKKDSSVSLRAIKECLQGRFTLTDIYVDSPAIVLDFGAGDWDTVEVIPADYLFKSENGFNVYDIPAPDGEWMKSSPMAHKDYVTKQNGRLGLKLKPLIRLLKAWKYYNGVPISSFYLELRTTRYMQDVSSIWHSIDLESVLTKLLNANLAWMQDPMGVSGYVKACKTDAMKTTALSTLKTAVTRAQKARDAEERGRMDDAFEYWDLLFNGNFPSRYYN